MQSPAAAANTISKRLALQKFHHQVWLTLMLADVVNGADIGVVQRRGGARLALEPFECSLVSKLIRQEL